MSPGAEPRRSPRRLPLLAVAAVLLSLLFVRLGFWQLERHAQRADFNREFAAAGEGSPVVLPGAELAGVRADPGAFAYRRAVASGVPRPAEAFLLRGRTRQGQPGVHLMLPLLLDDGSLLVVDRGWLPSADAVRADPAPFLEGLPDRFEGILFSLHPEEGLARPVRVEVNGRRVASVARLEPSALRAELAAEPLPLYLRELPSADRPGPPFAAAAPEPDAGPHLSYAVQWFSFATIALVGLLILWRRERA